MMRANKSLQLTFNSPLGLATPIPHVDSNAAELRRYVLRTDREFHGFKQEVINGRL